MHERYRQTTDVRSMTYSEREHAFTFAKNKQLTQSMKLSSIVGMDYNAVLIRGVREWLFTVPFPAIPMQSISIPSHSHSQFCDYFHSHPIPMDLVLPFPFSFPCNGLKYRTRNILLKIYVETKPVENSITGVMPIHFMFY